MDEYIGISTSKQDRRRDDGVNINLITLFRPTALCAICIGKRELLEASNITYRVYYIQDIYLSLPNSYFGTFLNLSDCLRFCNVIIRCTGNDGTYGN